MPRVDAHIHVNGDHADFLALLERLDVKLFNVCVAHGGDDWRTWAAACQALTRRHPERYAWCTTFDLPDFTPDYAERAIAALEADLRSGAIACKVWKNIGMEIRKPSGEFLMIDDPLFDPIYEYLARSGRTLLMHIGEPLACWQPLEEGKPHYGYYRDHPEWHMYTKPQYPSHQEIIAARDRVLAKHPRLRVVGAHLGSLEYDVAGIAKRLDAYPNFAVDTSARMGDLAFQDRETVRQFVKAYQDRVLWGTDMVMREALSGMPDEDRQARLEWAEGVWQREFRYYETAEMFQVARREVQGLALSPEVLEKLYHSNAAKWYPGLV
jgi:predicted TIM-barrel fold metal-dependent hydrolase